MLSNPPERVRGRAASTGFTVATLLAVALGGCMSNEPAPSLSPPAVASPDSGAANIAADQLVGQWGLAAYREEDDIARTEVEARAACGNPYTIGSGSAGGVVMHLADQAEPGELAIKYVGGRTFVGPATQPAGTPQDREITSYRRDLFVTKWVDPAVATRYGVMIYARCGSA